MKRIVEEVIKFVMVNRRVRRWMLPVTVSDEITNSSNTPHRRLFVASPTLPTLQQSPHHNGTSPSWGCRLPLPVCSCGRRAGPPDASTVPGRCCGVGGSGGRDAGRRPFEPDRLSLSVCGPPAECRRLSADDVSELSGGLLVNTRGRRTVDKPVYLPLGQNQRHAPSSDLDRHYFCGSIDGQDHAFISDGRLHDNPDLLFASWSFSQTRLLCLLSTVL